MDHAVLVAIRVGVVAAGGLAGLWCLRLGLRLGEDRRTYLTLAAGFALLAFGAVLEGVLFEFAGWSLLNAHTAQTLTSAAGLAAVLLAVLRSGV
ncbi:MAG TPA: hypothetical protein VJ400_07820 [Thermoplasmata archaeon]|nr:hypothetical protein [Thermoplasmata archaeon]